MASMMPTTDRTTEDVTTAALARVQQGLPALDPLSAAIVVAAAEAVICQVAAELADDETGDSWAYATTEGLMDAAGRPVCLAAVLADLCTALGIAPPRLVQLALGEPA